MTDDARFALTLIIAAVVMVLICVDAAREKRTRRRHARHADQGLHVAYQRPEVRTMGEER